MKRKMDYSVCRDNIWVGEVIKADNLYLYEGDEPFFNIEPGEFMVDNYESYRSILFSLDDNKLANDLLYKTRNYPILNISSKKDCLEAKDSIVIQDACNLDELIEYFYYPEYLTYDDIVDIRKRFFNGRFAMDNSELFGFKEVVPDNFKPFKFGKKIEDKKEIYRLYKKSLTLDSTRQFTSLSSSALPEKYFDILRQRGNNSLFDRLEYDLKMDVFRPSLKEEHIKQLIKR